MAQFTWREADKVEITALVDNFTDIFMTQSNEVVKRPRPRITLPDAPLAEHGLSFLVRVFEGAEEHLVLFDAGMVEKCILHNADALKYELNEVEAVVLSHGHIDHFGGLIGALKGMKEGTPLILHPEAFLKRRLNAPSFSVYSDLPRLDEEGIKKTGTEIRKIEGASTLASDLILVTGAVERVVDFEKGFPWAEARINGQWVRDPFHDDQGLAIKVKGMGSVVVGGCSHAGIINTVKYVQKTSQMDKVYAVLGGFHLTGPLFEPIITPTIKEMKRIQPDFVVPMHCTGWKAINRFLDEMPEQSILNSVGTTYVFK